MKKIVAMVRGIVLMAAVLLTGCGPKEPDMSKKYVIFLDNYGNEYRVNGVYAEKYYVEYAEDKLNYSFTYDAFYKDNDAATGEGGTAEIYALPGVYYIDALINLGYGPHEEFSLQLCVQTDPIVGLSPANTIEVVSNKKYTYRYDPNNKMYPTIYLDDYKGFSIELIDDATDYIKKCTNERGEECGVPKEVGVYQVTYSVSEDDYKDIHKQLIYHPVEITIEVEIIE